MAYSKDQWEKAKEYFEAGLSLSEINLRTEISRPQISKRAKKEGWEKGNIKKQIISQAVEVATIKETLNETALQVHNELVDEEVRRRGLVFDATEKLLKKIDYAMDNHKPLEKVNRGDGIQDLIPVEYGASDYKNFADAIDKASVTLGVNQRYANSQVTVNNQNNNMQQIELNKEIVTSTLESFEDEY